MEPARATDGLEGQWRPGDLRPGVVVQPVVEPAQLQCVQVQPAVIGDVVPGAHHQPQLIGHRLTGLHRLLVGPSGERVLQRRVIQWSTALERVMPAADEEDRHLVRDDLRQHRRRPQVLPEFFVERRLAAGDRIGDQRPEEAALSTSALAYPGDAAGAWPRMLAAMDHLQHRVDDVEQVVDPAVGTHRAQVRRPAHRRRIAVEVARGHHREDRFQWLSSARPRQR